MGAVIPWLRERLSRDPGLATAAGVLAFAVMLLTALDAATAAASMPALHLLGSPARSHGLLIGLGDLLAVLAGGAALVVAVRRPSAATVLAALAVIALATTRLVHAHLLLAAVLSRGIPLPPVAGLQPRELAKLLSEVAIGLACLGCTMAAARTAIDGTGRTAAALAGWTVVALAMAGGLPDVAQSWVRGVAPGARPLLAAIEIVGEALVLGTAVLGFVALSRRRCDERHRLRRADCETARRIAVPCGS